MCLEIKYLIYKYKKDLALNDLQWLIYYKTKPNQTNYSKVRWQLRWELQKDTASYFKQILEAASYKTTEQPLTFHLTNSPSKTSKIYWDLLLKSGRTRKRHFPVES